MSPQAPTAASRRATRPRRTQAERRADTRAKLLSAAAGVFARRGYHTATLDAIAAEAGVSKGALYYNYASKEDLFLALLEERLLANLQSAGDAYTREERQGTRPAIPAERMLQSVERDPRWPPLFFEFVAYCARDPELRNHFRDRFVRRGRRGLAAMIEQRATETGFDLPIPREDVATIVVALFNGLLLERVFDPASAPQGLMTKAVELLEAGLAHAPPRWE